MIALLFLLSLLSGMLPVDRDGYRRSYAYEEQSQSLAIDQNIFKVKNYDFGN